MLHYTPEQAARGAINSDDAETTLNRLQRRMMLLAACALGCLLLALGHTEAVQKSEAARQLEFGVKMALKGAWREAAFRFEKAGKAGGAGAQAFNNLAVAKESLGEFDSAREAYEKALALAPDNKTIRENHNRFMNSHTVQLKDPGGT